MAGLVAPALRALLKHSVDYAGLFPPAEVSVEEAVAAYRSYLTGENSWMLGRFVVNSKFLQRIPAEFDGLLSVVSNCDFSRAAIIESKLAVATSRPTYCEVAFENLDDVIRAGTYAKIRTGGLTPDAIPSVEHVARFITSCACKRLPFKATAGLHHPIRSMQPLSYEAGALYALMHGFINVLLASAFAWNGKKQPVIEAILAEEDAAAFRFDESAHWRNLKLDVKQISAARENFVHSFGSCSFTEPLESLRRFKFSI